MTLYPLSREEVDTKYQVNYIIEACGILDGSSFAQSVSKELTILCKGINLRSHSVSHCFEINIGIKLWDTETFNHYSKAFTVKASMVYLIKLNQQKTEQWNRQIGALKSIPNLAKMNATQAAELATELTSSIIYLNLFRK